MPLTARLAHSALQTGTSGKDVPRCAYSGRALTCIKAQRREQFTLDCTPHHALPRLARLPRRIRPLRARGRRRVVHGQGGDDGRHHRRRHGVHRACVSPSLSLPSPSLPCLAYGHGSANAQADAPADCCYLVNPSGDVLYNPQSKKCEPEWWRPNAIDTGAMVTCCENLGAGSHAW